MAMCESPGRRSNPSRCKLPKGLALLCAFLRSLASVRRSSVQAAFHVAALTAWLADTMPTCSQVGWRLVARMELSVEPLLRRWSSQ